MLMEGSDTVAVLKDLLDMGPTESDALRASGAVG